MKIVNTEKFFVLPPSIDKLIQKRLRDGDVPKEYNVNINLELLEGSSDFEYGIKYSSLMDTILNHLLQLNNIENKDVILNNILNLSYSIFYQPVFRGCSSVRRMEVHANDTILFSYDNINRNDEIPLGFNFWCHTPAVFSFTRIKLYASSDMSSVVFDTRVLYLDKDIFKNIATETNRVKTIDNKNILVGGGAYSIVENDEIKNYAIEVTHAFHTPYIQHPNKVKFRIWGTDNIRDVIRAYPQFIKEEGINNGSFFDIPIGSKMPWVEFLMRDDNVEEVLWRDVSVLYFYRIDIEYTIPQLIIDTYTGIANNIVRDKYFWKLKQSDEIGSSQLKRDDGAVKFVDDIDPPEYIESKSMEDIETEINRANLSLKGSINTFLATEERYIKSNFLNSYNTMAKVVFRVEVSKIAIQTMPPIHYVTLFYTNKSIEYTKIRAPDILRDFRDVLDEETLHELER